LAKNGVHNALIAYTSLIEQSDKYGLNLVNLISIDSVDDDTIEGKKL
jgi:hypothetical protein